MRSRPIVFALFVVADPVAAIDLRNPLLFAKKKLVVVTIIALVVALVIQLWIAAHLLIVSVIVLVKSPRQ